MGKEEQVEEREVLDAIFPDEITDIAEDDYRIKITLDVDQELGADDEEYVAPYFYLHVRYPADYPDKSPSLSILSPDDDGASRHAFFNVAQDKDELLSSLEPIIEENIGMAMIFTLVTTLKENAEQLIGDRKNASLREQEEIALAAEREENKKFHGTPVTIETFLAWRKDFIAEMEETERREEEERLAELKKAKAKEPPKLSGRQLWERGLAKGEEIEDDDDLPIDSLAKLNVTKAGVV